MVGQGRLGLQVVDPYLIRTVLATVTGAKVLAIAIFTGMATIFLSSNYAAQFGLAENPLPTQYPIVAIGAFIGTGILLLIAVMLQPNLFWPTLIVLATATGGAYVLGFSLFDEWLAGCVAIGGAVAVMGGFVPMRRRCERGPWALLFITFCVYLVLESVLGLVLYQNLKAARYIGVYSIVLLISLLTIHYDFPHPTSRTISHIIALSAGAYFALYLLHGFIYSDFIYVTSLEGIGGAGSGFAAYPVILAIPAAILILHYDSGWFRLVAWLTIILAATVVVLADARSGAIGILIFLLAAPLAVGFRVMCKVWIGILLAITIVGVLIWFNPYYLLNIYEEVVNTFQIQEGGETVTWSGKTGEMSKGDTSRYILILGAVDSIMDNPIRLFFGSGTYGFWPACGEYIQRLRESHGVPSDIMNYASVIGDGPVERPRPPSLAILIGETGLVGILLILFNVFLSIKKIIVKNCEPKTGLALHRPKIIIAIVPLVALLWGFGAAIQDLILIYLLIMPFGLMSAWGGNWSSWAAKVT